MDCMLLFFSFLLGVKESFFAFSLSDTFSEQTKCEWCRKLTHWVKIATESSLCFVDEEQTKSRDATRPKRRKKKHVLVCVCREAAEVVSVVGIRLFKLIVVCGYTHTHTFVRVSVMLQCGKWRLGFCDGGRGAFGVGAVQSPPMSLVMRRHPRKRLSRFLERVICLVREIDPSPSHRVQNLSP